MAFNTVRSKARNNLILLLPQKSSVANLNDQKGILKIRISESLEIFCEETATSALKTIASQNVPSEAQIYSFFSLLFHSQAIQVFVFLIIPSFTKPVTSR